ncbi:MAG: M42 family peptidase [Oscillospiraceae bacterium]|nr:M42 family peptidase [Oscillospiraceae bacterium]
MEHNEIWEALCGANGPSGFETPVIEQAEECLRPLVDETWIDAAGNLVGVRRCGKPNAARVLLDAHLDEVGLIVTGIDQGFLRFHTIGGVDPRILADCRVTVLTDPPIPGVLTCLPPHLQEKASFDQVLPVEEMRIDIGQSEEETKRMVPPGTPVAFYSPCFFMGDNFICGKAMDDRAGFVTLLRTLERLKGEKLPFDLYLMGSVKEEVGGSGAGNGTFAIEPNCCIAVDVTFGKSPDVSREKAFPLGSGAAIGTGPNMARWMTRRMERLAKEQKIPYQMEVMEASSGTNGWAMQTVREGIPTMVVSLPLKYMHTPVELLALSDVEAVSALLAAFLCTLEEEPACWNN